MARDHRYILLSPIVVFVLFILAQCVLQRYSSQVVRSLRHQVKATSRFEPGSRTTYISPVWHRLIDSQFGSFKLDSYADDTMDKEEREEWTSKHTKIEDSEEEAERLRMSPYIYHEREELKRLSSPVVQKEMKYISFYYPWDQTRKSFQMCRYNLCAYADTFSQAHVVAFKAALLRDYGVPSFSRPSYQKWVMFTSDPASKNYGLQRPEMRYKFNATCTYRLNSDISWIFGRLKKVEPVLYDYDKIYEAKEGVAAWFVSHCQTVSRREEYVSRMQKVVNSVKIFGLCNNVTCGNFNYHKDGTTPCLPLLSHKYKFYLSFENSFCEDYVTEKFFKLFHNIHVIPVVRGGVNYNKLFPSGVFINAADFKSPEELARYLVYLGNDKKRYVQMLRKKARWTVIRGGDPKHCKLCELAHTDTAPKSYPDLLEVFNGNYPHCWPPTDLRSALANIH